jgi:hypothetical protein
MTERIAETIVATGPGGRVLCPASPEPCTYVRFERDGREVAYWDVEEWIEDPTGVVGAILGAVRSTRGEG